MSYDTGSSTWTVPVDQLDRRMRAMDKAEAYINGIEAVQKDYRGHPVAPDADKHIARVLKAAAFLLGED